MFGRVRRLFGRNALEDYLEKIELAMEAKRAEYKRLEKEARYATVEAKEAERKKEEYAALAARYSSENKTEDALFALARATSYSQSAQLYSRKRQILEQQAENARAIYDALRAKRQEIRNRLRYSKKNGVPSMETEEVLELLGTGKNELAATGEDFQLYQEWQEERLDNIMDVSSQFVADVLGSSDIERAFEAMAASVGKDPVLYSVYQDVGRKILGEKQALAGETPG